MAQHKKDMMKEVCFYNFKCETENIKMLTIFF